MWLLFGLTAAFLEAAKNILSKYGTKEFNPFIVAWALVFFNCLITVPVALLSGMPVIGELFWVALAARTVLDVVAISMGMFAIQKGEISKVLPLLTFQTIINLFSSVLINKELPNALGITGVLLIVMGTYFLYKDESKGGLLEPFKTLVNNKPARLMMIANVIWGFVGSFHKLAIVNSSATFYAAVGSVALAAAFVPIMLVLVDRKELQKIFKPKIFSLLPMGIIDGFMTIAFALSQSLALTVYAVAVYQLSPLFSTVYAGVALKENIKSRIVPITIMIAGVVLIALA